VAFHEAIVRPIPRMYDIVVISQVRRITRSLRENLSGRWIRLKLNRDKGIKGDKGILGKDILGKDILGKDILEKGIYGKGIKG
jgi:hypothetical protein